MILFCCLLFWIGYLLLYFIRLSVWKKKNSVWEQTERKDIQDCQPEEFFNQLKRESGFSEDEKLSFRDVMFYYFKRNRLYLFWKKKVYFTKEYDEEQLKYARLKLSVVPVYRNFAWRIPAVCLLLFLTAAGSFGVVKSAVHLNGKLAWVIDDLRNSKSVEFTHDNLYADGVEGMLKDIGQKISLPEKLMIRTSFNLHFSPDGRIQTVDTMLYGYDADGNYVDSYLITYNAKRSEKIKIYFGGGDSGESYDVGKSLEPLVEALNVIPVKTVTAGWMEEEYGILCYGVRTWYSTDENIFVISQSGKSAPWDFFQNSKASGYSISVFCPENDSVVPKRYLYVDSLSAENNAQSNIGSDVWGGEDAEDRGGIADDGIEMWNNQIQDTDEGSLYHQQEDIATESLSQKDCEMTPLILEDYGTVTVEEQTFYSETDPEQEVYSYTIEEFFFTEGYQYAENINRTLSKIYQDYAKEAAASAENRKSNTAADYAEGMGVEYDRLLFPTLTCSEDPYISIYFHDVGYFGGAHPYTFRVSYTISTVSGEVLTLEEVLGKSMVEIVEENPQLSDWYNEEEGKIGDGFYLYQDWVVVYQGMLSGDFYREIWVRR